MSGRKTKDPFAKAKAKAKQGGTAVTAQAAVASPSGKNATKKETATSKNVSASVPDGAGGQVAAAGVVIEDLFAKLNEFVKDEKYVDIIKAADKILRHVPRDIEATRCKIVALLQEGRIDEALASVETLEGVEDVDVRVEKAYCLYKQTHHEEALALVQAIEPRTPLANQVEAQILYRMGNHASVIERYNELGGPSKKLTNDMMANLVAAYVSGGRSAEVPALVKELRVKGKEMFEVTYNAACALIERGQLEQAEQTLLVARRDGEEFLIGEGLETEAVEDDLAFISAQLAYTQQALGRTTEAADSYAALMRHKVPNEPSFAVACSNLVALRGAKEIQDGLKKLDTFVAEKKHEGEGGGLAGVAFVEKAVGEKLSANQRAAIHFNRVVLLLHGNRLDQAKANLRFLSPSFLDSHQAAILQASVLMKEKMYSEAMEVLARSAPGGETAEEERAVAQLMLAQAAVTAGRFREAAEALDGVEELRHEPAVLATAVDLRERAGDLDGAEATLDKGVEYWHGRMEEGGSGAAGVKSKCERVTLAAAQWKQQRQKHQDAAALFQRVLESNPGEDVREEALTGLVSSAAWFDLGLAEKYESQLSPLPGGTSMSSLDVVALERGASAPSFSSRMKRPLSDQPDTTKEKSLKKKKKRKIIYPKNFDPANPGPPPDPERWLPRRERSTYKPRKKDKRAGAQIRGAQGAVVREGSSEGGNKSSGGGLGTKGGKGGKEGGAASKGGAEADKGKEKEEKAGAAAAAAAAASKGKKAKKGRR
eukprot:TRINITY_DN32436_c0_g1_i1.p1 TRINITY_DN32436_c0_g1~~TRINITY_DN32436_c0_g1_i1.p1  ORF type:complete len:768 (-),score=204.30 TRINITY_DN32436_c0_g1_i1:277-2580(-)